MFHEGTVWTAVLKKVCTHLSCILHADDGCIWMILSETVEIGGCKENAHVWLAPFFATCSCHTVVCNCRRESNCEHKCGGPFLSTELHIIFKNLHIANLHM